MVGFRMGTSYFSSGNRLFETLALEQAPISAGNPLCAGGWAPKRINQSRF